MNTDYTGPTPTERFQQRVLADYSEGDTEFEEELINSYKVSVEEHLPQLDKSLATLDEKESILHSHDIKGSSSYIGAEAVRFVSGKIESLCKESQLEEASLHLDELKKEVTELFKLLDKYMASWKGGPVEDEKPNEAKKDTDTTHTNTAPATTATVTSVVVEEKHTDKTTANNNKPNTDSHHHNNSNTNYTTVTSAKPTTTTYTVTATNSSHTVAADKNTDTHILEEPKRGTPKN